VIELAAGTESYVMERDTLGKKKYKKERMEQKR